MSGKSTVFGHHVPDAGKKSEAQRFNASANNIPHQRRKVSRGFASVSYYEELARKRTEEAARQ